jgi:allantoate deiminase
MSRRAQRIIDWCRRLATLSEEEGRTTRTFLSPPMHEVLGRLGEWMGSFGMQVSVDAVGNLRGVLKGDSPRMIIGSHLDTVPDAGAFDGILGVVLGIALCEIASLRAQRPTIEVVGFSEEEGVRYGLPFIGSKALVGKLDRGLMRLIEPEVREFGLDPALTPQAQFAPETSAYLEVHIEQGPVLESLNLPLAVVDAIAGQTRAEVVFEGQANHAGTTPMALRRDAMTAAARWILRVEEIAKAHEGLVATVGRVDVTPNASNVVPGRVSVSVDVRHRSDEMRRNAVRQLKASAPNWETHLDQPAVPMDDSLRERLSRAIADCGYPVHHMTSGAGHDAMIVAPHLPSAMLFLRSPGGISHSPKESVLVEDVEAALTVAQAFVGITQSQVLPQAGAQ